MPPGASSGGGEGGLSTLVAASDQLVGYVGGITSPWTDSFVPLTGDPDGGGALVVVTANVYGGSVGGVPGRIELLLEGSGYPAGNSVDLWGYPVRYVSASLWVARGATLDVTVTASPTDGSVELLQVTYQTTYVVPV